MLSRTLNKLVASVALMVAFTLASFGVSFTFLSGNVGGTPISSAQVGLIGTDGIFVQMPTFFQLGSGVKEAQIQFRVEADAGYYLSGMTSDPNGNVQNNGVVDIQAIHPGNSTVGFNATSVALTTLGSSSGVFTGQPSTFEVTVNLVATGQGSGSLAKVSIYQAFYQQTAVPEPATLFGLLTGAATFINRKRGRKS